MKRFTVTMVTETDSNELDASAFDSPSIFGGENGAQICALTDDNSIIADLTIITIHAKEATKERVRRAKKGAKHGGQ